VSSAPTTDHELRRWAAKHGPAVLERAQAEAVQVLRAALIDAALRSRQDTGTVLPQIQETKQQPKPTDQAAAEHELLWAYCVLRDGDPHPPGLVGIEPQNGVERLQAGDLAMLVSRVPSAEFGAEPLSGNLNDLAWLERVARAHEAVLDATLAERTIVPLRMCTLYETAESARRALQRERASFIKALTALDGRLEWAVKVSIDAGRLIEAVEGSGDVGGPAAEHAERGEGSTYMRRRRSERAAREAASSLARSVADDVLARLQDWAISATTHPAQNRDLSGHRGEMVLNAACLVERSQTEELRELVAELEDRYRDLGALIELTGPWPPYNFIPAGSPDAVR
jgi:hypothetical protein